MNNSDLNFEEKLNQLKNLNNKKLINNYNNEYLFMLEKGLAKHHKFKLNRNLKKFKFYFLTFSAGYFVFSIVKYYYIIYYYIMYDVDIRKPRVSDYLIERFR
jgi:hypothetical protein